MAEARQRAESVVYIIGRKPITREQSWSKQGKDRKKRDRTYKAFPQLMGKGQVRHITRIRGKKIRTEHLESLPHGLLIEDVAFRVRIITVLYALHVLNRLAYKQMFGVVGNGVVTWYLDQRELQAPWRGNIRIGRLEKGGVYAQ
jgi:hypothetical protein